jgi:hypothetical protein
MSFIALAVPEHIVCLANEKVFIDENCRLSVHG